MSNQESTSPRKEFPNEPLQYKLKALVEELRHLIHTMPDSHHEIEKVAKHVLEVGREVAGSEAENGGNPKGVILHILSQPLSIPGSPYPISLLEAAQEFKKEEAYESNFFKILSIFHEFPGPTSTLIAELEILIDELKR